MNKIENISNIFESYQNLINFYEKNKNKVLSNIDVELHGSFDANMSATLGAILDLLAKRINRINFEYIEPDIEQILLRNDFLSYYGKRKEIDTEHTTIKFQKLKPVDGKYFTNYVVQELINRIELPKMSIALKEKIVEAIYEMFVNAQIHSETENIYTCGQFFPDRNKIEFTIVDTGVGYKNKVNNYFKSKLNAAQAIKWAVEDGNTTKSISGGIGLAILKEFVGLNGGKMQIVSDAGFYEYEGDNVITKIFSGSFPGTIVNLEFCTNDKKNYALKNEININDIF